MMCTEAAATALPVSAWTSLPAVDFVDAKKAALRASASMPSVRVAAELESSKRAVSNLESTVSLLLEEREQRVELTNAVTEQAMELEQNLATSRLETKAKEAALKKAMEKNIEVGYELKVTTANVAKMKGKLKEVNKQGAGLKTTNKKLAGDVMYYASELSAKEKASVGVRHYKFDSIQALKESRTAEALLRKQLEESETANRTAAAVASEEHKKMQAQLCSVTHAKESVEADLAASEDIVSELEESITSFEEEEQFLLASLDEAIAGRKTKDLEFAKLEELVVSALNDAKQLEGAFGATKSSLQSTEDSFIATSQSENEKARALAKSLAAETKLTKELASTKKQLAKSSTALASLTQANVGIATELNTFKQSVADLGSTIDELTEEKSTTSKSLKEEKKIRNAKSAELRKVSETLDAVTKARAAIEQDLVASEIETEAKKVALNKAVEKNIKVQSELRAATMALNGSTSAEEELASKLGQTKKMLADARKATTGAIAAAAKADQTASAYLAAVTAAKESAVAQLTIAKESVVAKLVATKATVSQFQSSVTVLQEERATLAAALEESEKRTADVIDAAASADQTASANLAAVTTAKNSAVAQLTAEKESVVAELDASKVVVLQFEASVAGLQEERATLTASLEDARQATATAMKAAASADRTATANFTAVTAELTQASDELATMNKTSRKLNEDLVIARKEVRDKQAELKKMTAEAATASSNNKEVEQLLKTSKATVIKLKASVAAFKEEESLQALALKNVEEDNYAKDDELTKISDELSATKKAGRKLNEDLVTARKEVRDKQAELNKSTADASITSSELKAATISIAKTEGDLKTSKKDGLKLKTVNSKLEGELAATKEWLKSTEEIVATKEKILAETAASLQASTSSESRVVDELSQTKTLLTEAAANILETVAAAKSAEEEASAKLADVVAEKTAVVAELGTAMGWLNDLKKRFYVVEVENAKLVEAARIRNEAIRTSLLGLIEP
jgi:chromosome segregation ATPase